MRRDVGQDFVPQKADVTVAHGIVERAPHRIFQCAMPLVCISLHERISWSDRRFRNLARVDEDANQDRNLLLRDQVIDHVQHRIVPIAIGVPAAVLKDHHSGGNFRIVLRRNINPVVTLHTVIDLAGVDDLLGKLARTVLPAGDTKEGRMPAGRAARRILLLGSSSGRNEDGLRIRCGRRHTRDRNHDMLHHGPGRFVDDEGGLRGRFEPKKKSGPWPLQAVPSFRSLASKLA